MLTDEFVGRCSTDLRLQPLYDAMVRAAMQLVVDRLATLHLLDRREPSESVRRAHWVAFRQSRNALLNACRTRTIETPAALSATDVARYVLRNIVIT